MTLSHSAYSSAFNGARGLVVLVEFVEELVSSAEVEDRLVELAGSLLSGSLVGCFLGEDAGEGGFGV